MARNPTFFFSYARQDNETPGPYLSQFFRDLEVTLAQYAGVSLADRKLGTFDRRVIDLGQNYREVLSRCAATDNSLVAILTPLYVNRRECGKELAMFLLRSRNLGIDQNGRLTGVEIVVLIRWLPGNAYSVNGRRNSVIPDFLALIQDVPPDDGTDEERTQAIRKYQRKGMQGCVSPNDQAYLELLNLIVTRIRDLGELPAAERFTLDDAPNAFVEDWRARFTAAGAPVLRFSPSPDTAAARMPRPLTSIVVFYITQLAFTLDQASVPFADGLIAEGAPDGSKPIDPALGALVADIREAAGAEGFNVFHAVSDPVVPVAGVSLLRRLVSLSSEGVQTCLVVDPGVWPGAGGLQHRRRHRRSPASYSRRIGRGVCFCQHSAIYLSMWRRWLLPWGFRLAWSGCRIHRRPAFQCYAGSLSIPEVACSERVRKSCQGQTDCHC